MYRGARALRIADGADEVHKVTIAKHYLKGIEPVEGWPSEWIPAKREAAVRKFADLVAVRGNPLDDITELQRVSAVIRNGDLVD